MGEPLDAPWLRQAIAKGLIPPEQLAGFAPAGRAKYGNRKVEIDGRVFDSEREARRYLVLKAEQQPGRIEGLRLQVRYPLHGPNGAEITAYVADFVYRRGGAEVVEDAKGFRTRVYRLKRKWMRDEYGVEIKEV